MIAIGVERKKNQSSMLFSESKKSSVKEVLIERILELTSDT